MSTPRPAAASTRLCSRCGAPMPRAMRRPLRRRGPAWESSASASACDRILLAPGQALTLNGIAQGVITDRITDLLRAGGAEHTLVDMGEFRAIGGRSAQEPWSVRLAGGGHALLTDRALATTEARGFSFDPEGRLPQLIDPATGTARADWARVSVIADSAGLADGLSTGLSLAPAAAIRAALPHLPGVEVRALDASGQEFRFT
ncbi:hypothetical protein DPM13_18995 [Paracoccus mutanolyticus]|uniref:FAD:protein FMN transferase n=1 Tax=Paracoccus mutanolyticus TaxID=1499308 RepID=A0ABM6WUC9_9RHOB|nr:hypothetical protein DPM13_18995 [Paracoccus mutanolyticus]